VLVLLLAYCYLCSMSNIFNNSIVYLIALSISVSALQKRCAEGLSRGERVWKLEWEVGKDLEMKKFY